MDKSEGKDWLSKTLNSVTEETAKIYKISKMKFEISTLERAKNEKLTWMSKKTMKLIAEGKIDEKLFAPVYASILDIDKKIEAVDKEAADIKNNITNPFTKKTQKSQLDEMLDYDDEIPDKKLKPKSLVKKSAGN